VRQGIETAAGNLGELVMADWVQTKISGDHDFDPDIIINTDTYS